MAFPLKVLTTTTVAQIRKLNAAKKNLDLRYSAQY
jgi:hypothetical protein